MQKEQPSRLRRNPGSARGHGHDAEIELHGQGNQRDVVPPLRLKVPPVKALQQDEGDEEREDEREDGRRLVLEAVIEGPVGHQGVEEIVLDVPPVVRHAPEHPFDTRETGSVVAHHQ